MQNRDICINQRWGGAISSKIRHICYEDIISLENLFTAWFEFRLGKSNKKDVQQFELNLEDNIFELHCELVAKTYKHSNYTPFYITDPKLRHIHKASVRDRLLHHAVFRILYTVFDKSFIFDSYSCRINKGTHRAVSRLERFAIKLSKNYSKNIFALKCDISKFFDSVDQRILLELIQRKISDKDTLRLVKEILISFSKSSGTGIPLGNVTSQLFANIYLNELDQFIKHKLKAKYYLRYCDDFIILNQSRNYLENIVFTIQDFLKAKLYLNLHPKKIIIRKLSQGIDFLGYVILPYHKVLRTRTKKRMFKKIQRKIEDYNLGTLSGDSLNQALQSYLGMLKHCNGYKLENRLKSIKLY